MGQCEKDALECGEDTVEAHGATFLADTIKKDAARSQDVLEKTFPMIHDIDPQKTKKPTPDNLSGVGF